MLKELRIENFAIIDQLELRFADQLIIFTGETGAGKSIIMDALHTLLGGRADNSFIRSQSERANLEATFQITATIRAPIHKILNKEDLLDDPDYLTIGREIRKNGRNVSRINGRSVGITLIREIGEYLVDIHGQSEHLSLLRVRQHQSLLDRFADIAGLRQPYRQTYQTLVNARKELVVLRQTERDAARRMDLLSYQINEIEGARLKKGEDDDLGEEHNRLANAEGLASLSQTALQLLEEAPPESPTIIDLMGTMITTLEDLKEIDSSQTEVHEKSLQIFEEITEISRQVRNYQETIEFNPKRLAQVEDRIELINNLKKKYGTTIEEVIAFGKKAKNDLEAITNAGDRIIELEKQEEKLLAELGKQGTALSQKRQEAAQKLQNLLELELKDLKMEGARFEVSFDQKPDAEGVPLSDGRRVAFDSNGIEKIEFLIETNPGEGYKPLVKVASGGETARLMLALKNVLAQADEVPTLVFDEIDQGIGGRVGSVVGQKLFSLATRHQVICITHLPQLAAFGQQHYQVLKQLDEGRTITQVQELSGDRRVTELAQMFGEVSNGTLQSAHEILAAVQEYANNHG